MSAARAAAGALLALVTLLAAGPGGAHTRSTSTSSWIFEPGEPRTAEVTVRLGWGDLLRAIPGMQAPSGRAGPGEHAGVDPDALTRVDAYLDERITLTTGGEPCRRAGPAGPATAADPSYLARRLRFVCPTPGAAVIEVRVLFDAIASHVHLARVVSAEGAAVEKLLISGEMRFEFDPERPVTDRSLLGFARVGIGHIASGADHVVFVLALLLVGASLADVAAVVTGFTVAHSVTLALAVLGVVRPLPSAIEALIGLTIVVVAVENFGQTVSARARRWLVGGTGLTLMLGAAAAGSGWLTVPPLALLGVGLFSTCYLGMLEFSARPERLRWLVAVVFGLVHGFGFGGFLAGAGLPPDRVAPALLGFNFGVEAGQLALVALVWPLLRALVTRGPAWRSGLVQVGSAAVLAAGLFWFVTRAA